VLCALGGVIGLGGLTANLRRVWAAVLNRVLPPSDSGPPAVSPQANVERLFPIDLPGSRWMQFPAAGFSKPCCGVIYREATPATNGLALGGIDTGCIDLETSGLWGYCTLFNTHIPRRGPLN